MFGTVIIDIGTSGRQIVTDLIMRFPAAEPVEEHVHGFGVFWDNGIVCDPIGDRVIHLEG